MSPPLDPPKTTRLRSWSLALVLLLVLADAGIWWITDALVNPAAGVWERAMFRPGGDVVYYPFVRALAEGNLGEPVDYATQGQGVWNFPWLQIAPVALLYKLMGPWCLLACDLLFQLLRWWLLYRILRVMQLPREWSQWLAALISLASGLALQGAMGHVWAPGALVFDRLTRPLITDPLFLGLAACLLAALRSAPGRIPLHALLGASLLVGAIPHGDFHMTVSAGPLFGGCLLWLAWRERKTRGALAQLLLAGLPALLLLAWFAWLTTRVSAEVSQRLGVFELAIFRLPKITDFYFSPLTWYYLGAFAIALALGAALNFRALRNGEGPGRDSRLLLALFLSWIALAFIAPWVNLLTVGKMAQVYQYAQRVGVLSYYLGSLGLCGLGYAAWARRQATQPQPRPPAGAWLLLPITLSCATFAFIIPDALGFARRTYHSWLNPMPEPVRASYRRDFRELEALLSAPEYAHHGRTLATLDVMVYAWWNFSGNGASYSVDPFATNIPDAVVEERLLRFMNLCEADGPRLLMSNTLVVFYFHSCGKYQFSPAKTYLEYKDLTMEERWYLRQIPFGAAWSIILPTPELQRIAARQEDLRRQAWQTPAESPIDLIVLNSAFDGFLHEPDPRLYEPVLRNPSFRVYRKRQTPQ